MGPIGEVFGKEGVAVGQVVPRAGGPCAEGGLNAVGVGQLQGPVDFVGADVVEELALPPLGERRPIRLCGLQQGEGAHDVGAGEGEGVRNAAVHVALGGKVDDAIDMLLFHEVEYALEVADVHLDKAVVRRILNVPQVGKVAGIGEFVYIDDSVFGVFVDEEAHDMAANEARSAGDDYIPFHVVLRLLSVGLTRTYFFYCAGFPFDWKNMCIFAK